MAFPDFWHKFVDLKLSPLMPVSLTLLSIYLGVKAYRRKSGAYIRGCFTPRQSRACNDEYVSEVVLENLKDRSVTIFGIYLRLGYNNHIEIEEFEDTPLTLKPFESYVKSYGPVEFYAVSDTRVRVNQLLYGNVKKTIFLATSDGKYKVRARVPRWKPIYDWVTNYTTATIQPIRSMHRGRSVGGNVKFIVDFVSDDGNVEAVHVESDQPSVFKNFRLTGEAMANKESLEEVLQKQIDEGRLVCKSFTVHDLEAWRTKKNEFYKGKTIEMEMYGAFRYFVLGRLFTFYQNRRVDSDNKNMAKARQQQKQSTVIPTDERSIDA
jgi:hypothetical protein